ncbi:MAG: ACP S-malonyltransferase [Bacteroidales bacterium OttesenSCG-928-I14]|jgi:[acyl-carrier-protein] S-malonyltransferase|nr:ACP S-malonyltransferase [Bacteroidales bacterium OttesenSCG-928-I14]
MNAFVFPGQGTQFPGMGFELYKKSAFSKKLFETANKILNFRISDFMFEGTAKELSQTKITQLAVFLHSVIATKNLNNFNPKMVAGHSLGEFSALVVSESLSFEDGLLLVYKRALAMQKACDSNPGTMAAIIGISETIVEETCNEIEKEIVVPANYNCPEQIVISGTLEGINIACKLLLKKGAKHVLKLNVNGAFHSPLMEQAKDELAEAISSITFTNPICPIYQNVTAKGEIVSTTIKNNLISQLISPVKWKQSIENMITDGAINFTEIGPGNVLKRLIQKINSSVILTNIK